MGRGREVEAHPLHRVGRGERAREGVSARQGGPGERAEWGPAGADRGASVLDSALTVVLAGLRAIYSVINVMQTVDTRHVLRLYTRVAAHPYICWLIGNG